MFVFLICCRTVFGLGCFLTKTWVDGEHSLAYPPFLPTLFWTWSLTLPYFALFCFSLLLTSYTFLGYPGT